MTLIKEPKNIDLKIKSKPWSEKELKDFRGLMTKIKSRNKRKNNQLKTKVSK